MGHARRKAAWRKAASNRLWQAAVLAIYDEEFRSVAELAQAQLTAQDLEDMSMACDEARALVPAALSTAPAPRPASLPAACRHPPPHGRA